MDKTEQLQIIIASYFKYWGDEVAEMLEMFEEIDQRRITQAFMSIIEGGHYVTGSDNAVKITIFVAHDIYCVVSAFITLYEFDRRSVQTLKLIKSALSKK